MKPYNLINKKELIRDYSEILSDGNASLFLGSGFSKNSGLPNWEELLRPVAKSMKLKIKKVLDYYDLAERFIQIHGQRTPLTSLIINQLQKDYLPNENHKIISRMPYSKIWTSNFDNLIELSFRDKGIALDVLSRDIDFTLPSKAKKKLYKIHGCVFKAPEDIVISRRDLENYLVQYKQMHQAFEGALAENTFLFLGFSFNDYNFKTIIGRLKQRFNKNQRQHYAIIKKPDKSLRKFHYFINDLSHYGIKVCLIDHYSEIPWILKDIERAIIRNNIFIAGSLDISYKTDNKNNNLDFKNNLPQFKSDKNEFDFNEYLAALGYQLAKNKFKLYTGNGHGVCNLVIEGASKYYVKKKNYQKVFNGLNVFPLPHRNSPLADQNKYYREGMIGACGFLIINRGNTSNSDYLSGTMDEYIIAKGLSRLILREQKLNIDKLEKKEKNISNIRKRQERIIIEKQIEFFFNYERIINEQWKLLLRAMNLIGEEFKLIGKLKRFEQKINVFIEKRMNIHFSKFSKKSKYQLDIDSKLNNELKNYIDTYKSNHTTTNPKLHRYLDALRRMLSGETKYYEQSILCSHISMHLTESEFAKSGNYRKLSKSDILNPMSMKKQNVIDAINTSLIFDLKIGYERIKAQRQIMRIHDSDNKSTQNKLQFGNYYEDGRESSDAFKFMSIDIDQILKFHQTSLKNHFKTKEKLHLYMKILNNLNDGNLELEDCIKKCRLIIDDIELIDIRSQLTNTPYRSGTLILPIGCFGGMAFKIWKEERPRFINRFAKDKRFKKKVAINNEKRTLSELLILSYDYLGNQKLEMNDSTQNTIINKINFIIYCFTSTGSISKLKKIAIANNE